MLHYVLAAADANGGAPPQAEPAAPAENGDGGHAPADEPPAAGAATGAAGGDGVDAATAGGPLAAGGPPATPRRPGGPAEAKQWMAGVLSKDAFLVFRALCKLSIRSSESAAGADPTAVRGKVCGVPSPCTCAP